MEGGTPPDGYEPLTLEEYEELTTVNEAAALDRFFERIANRGKRK